MLPHHMHHILKFQDPPISKHNHTRIFSQNKKVKINLPKCTHYADFISLKTKGISDNSTLKKIDKDRLRISTERQSAIHWAPELFSGPVFPKCTHTLSLFLSPLLGMSATETLSLSLSNFSFICFNFFFFCSSLYKYIQHMQRLTYTPPIFLCFSFCLTFTFTQIHSPSLSLSLTWRT